MKLRDVADARSLVFEKARFRWRGVDCVVRSGHWLEAWGPHGVQAGHALILGVRYLPPELVTEPPGQPIEIGLWGLPSNARIVEAEVPYERVVRLDEEVTVVVEDGERWIVVGDGDGPRCASCGRP